VDLVDNENKWVPRMARDDLTQLGHARRNRSHVFEFLAQASRQEAGKRCLATTWRAPDNGVEGYLIVNEPAERLAGTQNTSLTNKLVQVIGLERGKHPLSVIHGLGYTTGLLITQRSYSCPFRTRDYNYFLTSFTGKKEILMHPIAFTLGALTIRWYGIMIALSIAISVIFVYADSKRQGIDTDAVLDMAIAAVIGGILGARLGWIATSPDVAWYLVHPLRIIAVWEGGLSYFGGILGGILAANWMIRRRHLRFWQMADMVAPLLALSFGIGKIGCWLNGCCHGTVTTSWLGVVFTNPLSECELLGQKVWPTQLFNSASGFIVFGILFWIVRKHKKYEGEIFVWYLYLYGATSFIVEFYRYIPVHLLGLSPNQWTALVIIPTGYIASRILRRRRPSDSDPTSSSRTIDDTGEETPASSEN
jgi:phosphatidylglycerol:prolipoprotein diacylglycerol transferase